MLAKKFCSNEEAIDGYQVSISFSKGVITEGNATVAAEGVQKNDDAIIDYHGAKGIKKRDCAYKGKQRPKTWLEKAAKRNKTKTTQKTKKSRKTMVLIFIFLMYNVFLASLITFYY